MKWYAVLFAVGLGMASHCSAQGDARRDKLSLDMLEPKRKAFIPGEPIGVEVTLTNRSECPITDPGEHDWQLSLQDSSGRLLRKITPTAPPPGYYSVPGEKVAIRKILPGQSRTWRWDLQLHFEIVRPEAYTFRCRVVGVFVRWDEEIGPRSVRQTDRFAIEAKPFEFVLSETPLFWKESRRLSVDPMVTRRAIREVVFQAAELQEENTLSFYLADRHTRGERYLGFQQIGKLKSKDLPPKTKDYGGRRFGIRYLSLAGEKCVLIGYNGSRTDWVRLDLTEGADWPQWPDEQTWRRLKRHSSKEPAENGALPEPDRENRPPA